MANSDRPNGFRPYGELLRVSPYMAAGAIYPGDAVKQDAAGKVAVCSTGGTEHTGAIIGIAMGYAAADGDEILVADHPDQLVVGQTSGANVDAQTDIGLNYSIVGTDPSTTYKRSRQEIKHDSGATSGTLPLKLLRVTTRVGEDGLGTNAECICAINNHQLKGGTGTDGV